MAKEGASGVIIADLNVEAAEEVVEGIKAVAHHPHFRAEAIKVDVSLEESVKDAVAHTVGLFGRIDYAVHCAGVPGGSSDPIADASFVDFKRLMEVNVHGTFLVTSLVSAAMKSQEAKQVSAAGVYTYVEIVFPFYDRDLRHEFELQKSRRASIPRAESLLGDPLWASCADVINSASIMHEAIESGAVECVGHFDIKPENIVIKEDNKGAQKLFLIDFGQSAANLAGTNDYQPPEVTWPRSNTSPLELKYDVWSMACVLLEVLVFIDSGFYELQMFRARVKGSDESAMAFWQGTSPHDIVLRYAVTDRLKTFEDQGDRRTQAVIRQLRAMLRTDPANRPTMRSCLGEFTRLNLNREELGLATQDMMDCGLEKWKTSYSTSRMPRPNPGDLYFYRDKPGQAIEYATLDIESVIRDTQPLKNVSFVPRAFFNMSTKPGHTFACHFGNFHKGFTFYFSLLEQFLEFMSLLTYQRIVPDIAEDRTASGTRFEVEKCHIKIHGRIADRTRRFKGGTVQIWRQLSQTGYDRWHKRSGPLTTITSSTESSDGTGASTAGVNVKLPANVWKLALWTHDEKTNERICIVIDIGAKTWRLEDPSGRTPRRLKIKPHHGHADFRGAIFEPLTTDQDGNASEDRYPGIPISPVELQSRMQLRMKEATIELSDDICKSSHQKKGVRILINMMG
ncbi:hypothetical protein KJ359_006180 [Pestalotiopsis sp. 9143b]|nr:hypothetical protein KJ359_006180 [Pestalotiopsis sp. 9143b]